MVAKIVVALSLLAAVNIGESVECPGGWTRYGTSCYVILKDFVNWYEGSVACDTINGKLVKIEDADQNNFINNLLQSNHVSYAWIGLEDLLVEGRFVWASDASVPQYTNFHLRQPDDAGHTEDCVMMRNNGDWYDDHCRSSIHPTICQAAAHVANEEEVIG